MKRIVVPCCGTMLLGSLEASKDRTNFYVYLVKRWINDTGARLGVLRKLYN